MSMIYCNINPFDYTVNIQIVEEKSQASTMCNLEEIYSFIPELAKKYGITKVVLGGGKFGEGFVEEIQAEAAMKYDLNNLEIEVI